MGPERLEPTPRLPLRRRLRYPVHTGFVVHGRRRPRSARRRLRGRDQHPRHAADDLQHRALRRSRADDRASTSSRPTASRGSPSATVAPAARSSSSRSPHAYPGHPRRARRRACPSPTRSRSRPASPTAACSSTTTRRPPEPRSRTRRRSRSTGTSRRARASRGIGCSLAASNPTDGCDAIGAAVYNPVTNPKGARCTLADISVNVLGVDPKTGFANRPLDNTGVQYGLRRAARRHDLRSTSSSTSTRVSAATTSTATSSRQRGSDRREDRGDRVQGRCGHGCRSAATPPDHPAQLLLGRGRRHPHPLPRVLDPGAAEARRPGRSESGALDRAFGRMSRRSCSATRRTATHR